MSRLGGTRPFRGPGGEILPGSIAEVRYLRLGGIDQWVMIRGENVANPPLILLHGGPGMSETRFFRARNAPLETAFTVVYWDQRGTGKSFHPGIPRSSMTIDRFVRDLDELVDGVRRRVGQERVTIFGHSWGSVLGALYAARFPEKVAAYVGCAQIADAAAAESASYAWALAEAERRGSRRALRALRAIGPPPYDARGVWTERMWVSRLEGRANARTLWEFGRMFLGGPESSLRDLPGLWRGFRFSLDAMWAECSAVDLSETVPALRMPVFFFLGRRDRWVPPETSVAYCDALRAPSKTLVWFEASGHEMFADEPERFNASMLGLVRPVAAAAGQRRRSSPAPPDQRGGADGSKAGGRAAESRGRPPPRRHRPPRVGHVCPWGVPPPPCPGTARERSGGPALWTGRRQGRSPEAGAGIRPPRSGRCRWRRGRLPAPAAAVLPPHHNPAFPYSRRAAPLTASPRPRASVKGIRGARAGPPHGPTPRAGGGAMDATVIRKPRGGWTVTPNLADYDLARATFSWTAAERRELSGLPGGAGLNIAHEAVDRHAYGPLRDRAALRWLGRGGEEVHLTYGGLRRLTARFANVLGTLGLPPGARVFGLLGRVPELYVAVLGTLKARAVFSPLFSAFGPEPIRARLSLGEGAVLVTTPALYARKVAGIRESLPDLRHVLLVRPAGEEGELPPDTRDLGALLDAAPDEFAIPPTDPEDPALLHFTSGTTGRPKGAVHVHRAVVSHHVTGRLALDLHPDDVFWCTADPGWVTGTSYGIIAPLTNGVTMVVDEGDFDAERWYRILQEQQVTVWYTAPTAIRMLMKAGDELPRRHDLSRLRLVASVGEPLNPEAVLWGERVLGRPIHDNWWQTETGGIMVSNYLSMDVRPGSMGRPLPGIDAAIVQRAEDGGVREVEAGEQGELALRPGWPSMFRGYLNEEERYRGCFAGGWYLTGDLARRDADGYFWFVGRADDVIKSSGHLVGPFEVESALLEHPAVAEAGVIGKPDPVAGEVVKAFVALKPGHEESEELRMELLGFARRRLGPAVAPKEIAFLPSVPKNRAGKIMRRVLKARELGLPEGDVSTMETAA